MMETVGAKIDALHELRERKRSAELVAKELSEQMRTIEHELIEQMGREGVSKATGHKATASVNTRVVPQVEDWDAFYKFIHRHQYYHLLERRPSVSGCNELFEMKGAIPGVVPFSKQVVNLRTTE